MAKISGGKNLQNAMSQIAKSLKSGGKVRIGFMEDAKYPDGTSVAMAAAINNYGAPRAGIPPRPFFSNMVKDKASGWPEAIRENLKQTNYNTHLTLDRVGAGIASQLRDAIIDTNDPPLSPVTIMLRGMKGNDTSLKVTGKTVGEAAERVREGKTNYGASTKVLDDTGHMLASVNHVVDAE